MKTDEIMDKDFDYSIKLGEIFTNLKDIDMTVHEMDFSVVIYNALTRGGINTLQQLLDLSGEEIMRLRFGSGGLERKKRMLAHIIDHIKILGDDWLKLEDKNNGHI